MKKRKNHTPGFKTKVVMEAIQERETIQVIGLFTSPVANNGKEL